MPFPTDSPLSITASIAGILTFVFALAASIYIRLTYLANADQEYFRVKSSLSWYKTESTWLEELIRATPSSPVPSTINGGTNSDAGARVNGISHPPGHGLSPTTSALLQHQIYIFTTDQLRQLESRLLDLLTEAEMRAAGSSNEKSRWTIVGGGGTGIAVAWLRVRARALELVRQRDALGGRVLFVQLSAVERRVGECRREVREMERKVEERLERMEALMNRREGLGVGVVEEASNGDLGRVACGRRVRDGYREDIAGRRRSAESSGSDDGRVTYDANPRPR